MSNGQILCETWQKLAQTLRFDDSMVISQTTLKSEITCLQYLEGFAKIVVGTRSGEFLMIDFLKKIDQMTLSFDNQEIT